MMHTSSDCFSRLVGVGEASFISLAAPFIDDNAPVAKVLFPFIWSCQICLIGVYFYLY
jgi:hypothetical protein